MKRYNRFQKSVLIVIALCLIVLVFSNFIKKTVKEESLPIPSNVVETIDSDPDIIPDKDDTVVTPKEKENPKSLQINNVSVGITPTQTEPSTPDIIINIQREEKAPEVVKDDIFKDQIIPSMATQEKLYSITPQKGSPLKPREDITLEQLRDYVIQTNYQVVAFREKMATATAEELITYLEHNGFTVKIK